MALAEAILGEERTMTPTWRHATPDDTLRVQSNPALWSAPCCQEMVVMMPDAFPRLAALPSIVSIPGRALVGIAERLPVQHTPLLGREQELASLRELLSRDDVRLVTLVGPGGIGKTRLAIGLAQQMGDAFVDGVAFVALAGVREAGLILPTIYRALSGRESGSDFSIERLYHLLEERELLLILDNFEHVLPAADAMIDLLTACPRLTLLITSRATLRLSGEHDVLVPPLALPDRVADGDTAELLRSDAVRLFLQRAGAARLGFSPSEDEVAAVAAICHRLDGLPLAIELAAARVTHLSPRALLSRLDLPGSRLPLLTGGRRDQPARHQTLRDTVAWSHDLLDQDEQRLFQSLAVFVDGFAIAAASAVCALDEGTMLDAIGSLIAKSLVRYEGDCRGEPRYHMFETIREFGLAHLALSGREDDVRARHAAWAIAFAEEAGPQAKGPDAACYLEALERDHASLRAALDWLAARGDGPQLARLAGALWPFWEEHAHYAEGRRWLEAALALAQDSPARDRLQLLTGAGTMARHQADFAHGIVRHEQALALARELGDREAEAIAHNHIGAQLLDLGDYAEARARFEACVVLAREAGAPHLAIRALNNLGQMRRVQHDSEAALRSLEEVLELARERNLSWLLPSIIGGMALTATDLGDCERAIALFHESLYLALAKGNLGSVIDGIEGLARVAATAGQADVAVRLFAAGVALRDKLTFPLSPTEIAYAEPIMQALRQSLGVDGFAAAWAAGQALTQEAAVETALALQAAAARGDGARESAACLTERELEVLRLLAAGYSNRELADRLYISPATAARHIANIYNKLGVDSRAKATAFAHQHGLLDNTLSHAALN